MQTIFPGLVANLGMSFGFGCKCSLESPSSHSCLPPTCLGKSFPCSEMLEEEVVLASVELSFYKLV